MATRFYLPASTAATAISPTPDADWESTAFLGRAVTRTAKLSDTLADVAIDDANNTNQDLILRQYVSQILTTGQTVTGAQALKAQCRVSETGTGNNMFFAVGARIIAEDGTTVRKTVLTVTRDATEAATTLTNRQFTATSAVTNYTTLAGDRLVIEIGMGGDPTGGNPHDSTMRLGDSGASDLAENDTATTDDNPWFELNDTLTFMQPVLDLDPGSYSISGTSSDLLRGLQLPCDPGAYAISGTSADVLRGLQLACDPGAYAISGTDVSLEADTAAELACAPGAYAIAGTSADLLRGLQIACDSGTYAISGASLDFLRTLQIPCDAGLYTIAGSSTELQYSGSAASISADPGTYTISGTSADLQVGRLLTADSGEYLLSGTEIGLTISRTLTADSGIYSISGVEPTVSAGKLLDCSGGQYDVDGTATGLTVSRSLQADSTTYLITGTAVDLSSSVESSLRFIRGWIAKKRRV